MSAERCEGKREVSAKYVNAEGQPTLDLKCEKGTMYIVWEADNEDDRKEWDNYSVGQEYTG